MFGNKMANISVRNKRKPQKIFIVKDSDNVYTESLQSVICVGKIREICEYNQQIITNRRYDQGKKG